MDRKAVIVAGALGGGGAERVFLNLANELCAQGLQVIVLVTGRYVEKPYKLNPEIQVEYITSDAKNKLLKILDKYRKLRQFMKRHRDHTFISYFPDVSAYCVFAGFGLGSKNIVSERNNPYEIPKKKGMKLIRNLAFCFADLCVLQTEEVLAYFPKCVRKKSVIINNPLKLENLPDYWADTVKRKIILGIGRVVPQKNFLLLIRAFHKIMEEYPDYNVEIYGEVSKRSQAEVDYIKEHNLGGRVLLKGFCDNIYSVLQTAEIYVSSSDFEGISNSMLEALALGIPSIITDCPVGGAKKFIKDGYNGLLVPTGDVDKMAVAIRELLSGGEKRRYLASNAIKIRDQVRMDKICREWIALL